MTVERTALRWALYLLLLLSPLPFGAVQPWAVCAIEITAAALGALALWIFVRDPAGLPVRAGSLLAPVGLILVVGILQLLPAPAGWVRLVAAPVAEARASISALVPEVAWGWAPQSLEPTATLDALLRFAAWALIGFSAVVAIRSPAQRWAAVRVIALSGAIQGLYGAAEFLSGRQHIVGYAKTAYLGSASGTFVNRNHFAGYIVLTLPFALGLVLHGAQRVFATPSWRERLLRLAGPAGTALVLGIIASSSVWAGIVLSYSRSGLVVALVAVGLVLVLSSAGRHRVLVTVLVLALPTLVLLGQAIRGPGERFAASPETILSLHGRVPAWGATLHMTASYFTLGSGLGTFESAFPPFQPSTLAARWDHAHNDWLQSLAEGGPLVTLAIAAIVVFALRRRGSRRSVFEVCVTAAILAGALLALVDFSLRIPAVAALGATLLGLACIDSGDGAASLWPAPRHK